MIVAELRDHGHIIETVLHIVINTDGTDIRRTNKGLDDHEDDGTRKFILPLFFIQDHHRSLLNLIHPGFLNRLHIPNRLSGIDVILSYNPFQTGDSLFTFRTDRQFHICHIGIVFLRLFIGKFHPIEIRLWSVIGIGTENLNDRDEGIHDIGEILSGSYNDKEGIVGHYLCLIGSGIGFDDIILTIIFINPDIPLKEIWIDDMVAFNEGTTRRFHWYNSPPYKKKGSLQIHLPRDP